MRCRGVTGTILGTLCASTPLSIFSVMTKASQQLSKESKEEESIVGAFVLIMTDNGCAYY